jgi:hypothetical protein
MSKHDILAEHLKEHPLCTEFTCPHTKNYFAKVIFDQPDHGFIATVQAFNEEQAEQVVREDLPVTHPHLTVKSVEVG